MSTDEIDWQADVYRVLKQHDVKHIVYVPDAGHLICPRRVDRFVC
jgi:hypothetical protein